MKARSTQRLPPRTESPSPQPLGSRTASKSSVLRSDHLQALGSRLSGPGLQAARRDVAKVKGRLRDLEETGKRRLARAELAEAKEKEEEWQRQQAQRQKQHDEREATVVGVETLTEAQITFIEQKTGKSLDELVEDEIHEILLDPDIEEDEGEYVESATPIVKKKRTRAAYDTADEESDHDCASVMQSRPDSNKVVGWDSSKRRKGNNAPTFSASSPQPIASKLPPRRQGPAKTSANPRYRSTLPSSEPPLPTSPDRPTDDSREPPSTPVAQRGTSSKVTFSQQTSNSQLLLPRAAKIFRVTLAVEDAFPPQEAVDSRVKGCFKQAAEELDQPALDHRFKDNLAYKKQAIDCIKRARSQTRGEVKTKAQGIVVSQYNIPIHQGEEQVKKKVEKLLDKSAFTFADPEKRSGFYSHPIFVEIIAKQWFDPTKKTSDGIKYVDAFNPIPLPVLALVATAIECALKDWESGHRISKKKNNEFSADDYAESYARRLQMLTNKESKEPAFFESLTRDLFQKAWKLGGNSPLKPKEAEDDYDDVDFAAEAAQLRQGQ
ncbi:hypothetical protein GLOTRDRAFT_131175 [Gloeophyllum trabeum ATCC 11539]|uniref:DUF6532 domain-containing protein n=1 Tax=Gloeophyllum trabeum (strain ATCC 11539 / FP-39264 / Madison 617) TaxID=670483 RepID=S7RHS8_GLOTA|nr:uncharacterized protein GLOTRDRAFT_131175 [Gloeophyllum trabeum ATCC 11539]EPQ53845.1 hypothetical protein GLOTRDRAFT_131175 [Gloeophyllum trabeum ATCC 11539]